ncbi:MAG TPA: hypothetical protein VH592_20415 [Gemmataceae bacterium]
MPSTLGNLLTQFGQNSISNLVSGGALVAKVNADLLAYKAFGPNFGILESLVTDTLALQKAAQQFSGTVELLGDGIALANGTGQLSTGEANTLIFLFDDAQGLAKTLTNQANQAMGDTAQILIGLLFGVPANPTLIPTTTTTPTQTNGTATESINQAPATASESGGPIMQSVTVSNPSNSPVQVTISYSATDGTSSSQTDTCTGSTITVQDGAPPSAPGVVGTWTTTVTGLPTQTNTTTWTE